MKKTLFLLLMVQAIVFAQNPSKVEKLRITDNITSTTAPFVAVIENNGEVNKITKVDLIDVLNFASAVNLPTTGIAGKIYVTNDDNKIYRWNGTIYQPLAVTDISGKQNTLVSGTNIKTINGNSILGSGDLAISGGGSTVNTAFTEKTFAITMSVAHDPVSPNFFVNITGDFSLAITGTQNGDSGIVNLNFAGTQVATLTATANKVITGDSATIQVYFIHDEFGFKWYRDESGDVSNITLDQVVKNDPTIYQGFNIYTSEINPTGLTQFYGNSNTVADLVTGQDTRQEPSKFVFFDGNSSFAYIKSRHDGGSKQKDFFLPNKPTGEYTLATLDDIGSGGAPTLQSVLNAGTYATKGSSYVSLLDGANTYTEIFNSNGLTGASKFETYAGFFNTSLTMHNISGTNQGTINFDNGKLAMYQKVGSATTTMDFTDPTVNTTIKLPAKTVAGNYVVKTRPLNSYTVATLPAAVLNDEATVTDATSAAALTGGGTLTIPVWYNGTAWTKLGGGSGGGTVDLSSYATKTYTDTKVAELVINNSGDAAALLYDKDAVDTPVNVIARITQRELINNSVGRFMIPSQVTTTNLPITRFDIDFKNSFIGRTVRFAVFTKTGNNFTLDYITDPYLAERDGLFLANVAPITVTAGKYIGSLISGTTDNNAGLGIIRDFGTPVPNGNGFAFDTPSTTLGNTFTPYAIGTYAGLLINAYQTAFSYKQDFLKGYTAKKTNGIFATKLFNKTESSIQSFSYPVTNALLIPANSIVASDGYIQRIDVDMFGADANRTVQVVSLKLENGVFTVLEKGTLLPCPKEGTTTIDLVEPVKCFAGNYIGFNVSASSTATGQNYRNGVGSGYAMRTYKDLDKGYYSSPPLQTTLYNNIPYFIKTKLVSAADSNVPGGFVAMDAKKQMDVSVQPYLNRWVGKKIVWVGTSIPAQGGEFSYPNRLGRMLGANVVNNARSSSLITYPDAFGLSGTTAELNAQTGTGQFSYQNLIIGQNADMLVIDHSVNDILNKLPQAFTGNINSTDRSTLYGAYNTIIQAAIADKPSIEIVIVVPPNKFTAPEVGANATTANYVTLIGILKEIANKYNAPFVNLAELSNINSFNYTNYKADGLHPTAADQERLAYILANQLIKI